MDTATVAIAIGLIVSLIFTELFGLSGGGMIVPGYLALNLTKPYSILMTLAAAFLTYWIVTNIAKVAIVYGRRRIVLMILFGFLVGGISRGCVGLHFQSPDVEANALAGSCFCVVGFIIPGLIALWMDRQGIMQTLGPLLTSSIVVRLVLILIGLEMAQ